MNEVVVTGAGIVSPIASGVDAFWDALLSGRHGFTAIPDTVDLPANGYWAGVPDAYLTRTNLPPDFLRNADRFTQYAVIAAAQAFSMADLELPPAKTADFVSQARIFGLTYLYFCAFTLEHLGLASRISEETLAAIRSLSIAIPEDAGSVDTTGWLESVRKMIRLQQRFTPMSLAGTTGHDKQAGTPGAVASYVHSDNCYAQVAGFVSALLKRGGFGVRSNLWDTCLALSVGALLGLRPPEDVVSFIDSLQEPPVGFLMAPRSVVSNLEVAYAGARCSEILDLTVRHRHEMVDLTLSCQSSNGGFAHAPMALPNLELTYRGLQTLAMLVPQLRQRAAQR